MNPPLFFMYKLALSLHSSSKVRLKPALDAAWAAVSRSPSSWWSTVAPACGGRFLYFEESLTFVTNLEKEGHHLGEPPTSGKLKRGAAREVENVAVAAPVQQRGHCRRLEGKSYQI